MMIPHIIFVDNTPIFYDASPTQLCYLRCILICFKAVSSMRIDENETEIVPIGEGLNFFMNFQAIIMAVVFPLFLRNTWVCLWELASRQGTSWTLSIYH